MPGRTYSSSIYRYSINGQEKENDLNENITTAEYWEYDSRIGRRWNVDQRPNVSFSPFATFGNNPIWNTDFKGDSLQVGNSPQSKTDIQSIAKSENRNFIKIDNKSGQLSLDFAGKNKDEINNILTNDEGLNLLNDLSISLKKFYYGAEDYATAYAPDGRATWYYPEENVNVDVDGKFSTILNHSNGGLNSNNQTIKPIGFDGGVYIKPSATYTENRGDGDVVLDRANIVFHELAENFERTANNIDYRDKHSNLSNGAHSRAIIRESKFWGNGTSYLSGQKGTKLNVSNTYQILKIPLLLINIQNGKATSREINDKLTEYELELWQH